MARTTKLTALTVAIVLLAGAAFVRAQMLKQVDPPIRDIEIGRRVVLGEEPARLSFDLRRAQPVTAAIVDGDDATVRELLDGALRGSGNVRLEWDGTDSAGQVVPEGGYRLRVDLAAPDRSITLPDEVQVRR